MSWWIMNLTQVGCDCLSNWIRMLRMGNNVMIFVLILIWTLKIDTVTFIPFDIVTIQTEILGKSRFNLAPQLWELTQVFTFIPSTNLYSTQNSSYNVYHNIYRSRSWISGFISLHFIGTNISVNIYSYWIISLVSVGSLISTASLHQVL